MVSFGIPYWGSKNRIAAKIIRRMPKGKRFVDLFAGGCAISHAAMLSGKYEHVHMNDKYGGCIRLFQECLSRIVSSGFISRQEFFQRYKNEELVRWIWSYCNAGRTYAFGKDKEDEAKNDFERCGKGISRVIRRRIMRLHSIRKLSHLCKCGMSSSFVDYMEVPLEEGDVVYLDPPYSGGVGYSGTSKVSAFTSEYFDYARKLAQRGLAVYVSEFTDNKPDDFATVATFEIQHLKDTVSTRRSKGLFTPLRGSAYK